MSESSRGERPARGALGRSGFTLVELLVVMAILAVLAGMILGALNAARVATNITRTRSLVTRLGQAVMSKWDTYRTRRIALPAVAGQTSQLRAQQRLMAMWDLQRMELPDIWEDVSTGPLVAGMQRPAVSRGYEARRSAKNPTNDWNNAETLYLICQLGLGAEGMSAAELGKSMVRDLDNDGYPEFTDAWGTPVEFFRWPAGMVSDVMPLKGTTAPFRDPQNDPDPLDYARLAVSNDVNVWQYGYRVVPIVSSAGPDVKSGFFGHLPQSGTDTLGNQGLIVQKNLNPWLQPAATSGSTPVPWEKDPSPWELGQCGGRKRAQSGMDKYDSSADNIHSHQGGMK